MHNITYFDVAGQAVTTHRIGLIKLEVKTNSSAAAGFIQIHDSRTVPANGAVPIKSWAVGGDESHYKEFKNGELRLANGLYVCFSTTEATKTLGTGSNKFSTVSVELYDPEAPTGTTYVVDTGVMEKEIWTDAAGPKKLIRAFVTNLEGSDTYLMLFAHDPADGDVPIKEWKVYGTGDSLGRDSIVLDFGSSGIDVMQKTSALVTQDGCYFALSATSGELIEVVVSGMNITAEYI